MPRYLGGNLRILFGGIARVGRLRWDCDVVEGEYERALFMTSIYDSHIYVEHHFMTKFLRSLLFIACVGVSFSSA